MAGEGMPEFTSHAFLCINKIIRRATGRTPYHPNGKPVRAVCNLRPDHVRQLPAGSDGQSTHTQSNKTTGIIHELSQKSLRFWIYGVRGIFANEEVS
jgi:hypothetical protein